MNLADCRAKIVELQENLREQQNALARLVRAGAKGSAEKKDEVSKRIAVLCYQISALEKYEVMGGKIKELGDNVPSIDEILNGASEVATGLLEKGKGLLLALKGKVLGAFDFEQIEEEKNHHFAAVISLLKAGRRDSAFTELRKLENEAGLSPVEDKQLSRTIDVVVSLIEAGQEESALIVLTKLYS